MKILIHLLIAAVSLMAAACVCATEIVVAQIVPLSGPVGGAGSMFAAGASLYFDHVNQNGGVKGQRIRHLKIDDRYDVGTSTLKVRELLDGGRFRQCF